MSIYVISPIINLIVASFVGGVIWRKSDDRTLGNTFAAFSFSIAVWSLGYLFWQLSSSTGEALLWIRFFMAGAIFSPIFFFHFTLAYLNRISEYIKSLYFGYIFMAIFAGANFTNFFVSGVEPILNFEYWPEPGILFHPFLIVWLFYAVYAIYLLTSTYLSTQDINKKTQLQYILFGIGIAYAGGVTNYFLWYDITVPPIGTISASIYLGLVAYAVAKHQLFDTKVILTEFFSWVLMGVLTINAFLSSSISELVRNLAIIFMVGVTIYLLVKSVYEEVKSREQAEKLTKELKELNDEKSRMLSIASHQFRSPLTSIKGYASMIKEGSYGNVPEYLDEPISRIVKSSQKLAHIVDDFLNISRIEDGRMDYNFQHTDLEEIVNEVIEEAEGSIDEEKLTLNFETDESDAYPAEVDIGKFQQVITNLVDNAIKYTEEGNIIVRLKRDGPSLIVEVEDDGIGIDPDDIDGIFHQFSRADEARDVNVVGSGLGLYIAQQIIDAHHGQIWATSPGEGEGSTFHVRIPAANSDND